MADKGFQIQDILPLGVSLNLPPTQMSAEDVIRTQPIARIHVERAISKMKNLHIWEGVVPLSVANKMTSVCAFLCNTHDPPLIAECI